MPNTLIPAWKTGTHIEIIGTGLTGSVLSPKDTSLETYFVKLDSNCIRDARYQRSVVVAHATQLRAFP